MCEFLINLEPSDWIDIFQALIALFSAILLARTLNLQRDVSRTQKKNNETALQMMQLDQKAKRAEYLPNFEVLQGENIYPMGKYPKTSPRPDFTIDKESTIEFILIVKKNAIKIIGHQILTNNGETIIRDKDHFSIDKDEIIQPNTEVKLSHNINILNHYKLFDPDLNSNYCDIMTNVNIENMISDYKLIHLVQIEDMLGFKYELEISSKGFKNPEITNITLLN